MLLVNGKGLLHYFDDANHVYITPQVSQAQHQTQFHLMNVVSFAYHMKQVCSE